VYVLSILKQNRAANCEKQKKHFGNLPAICRSKKNILETFLQFAGAKKTFW
jgi:hypothetical protein